jgi:small-conductance mechanosensitive channel
MGDFVSHKIAAVHGLLLSNSVTDWLMAAVIGVTVWSGLWVLRQLTATHYKKYSGARHRLPIRLVAYLIGNTRQFLFAAIALYAAQAGLTLPDKIQHIVANIVLILILLQVGLWAGRAVRFYMEMKELERGADQVFAGSLDIINFVARMLIWSLLSLVALDNLGVNITALLAGLGVGGVAVALALQNVLGDLFASLSIALDKPFVVGDTLVLDTFTGKVERIGIKTTRLRSDTGEQIILSNADILKSRVRNFGRAQEQRALATIRVTYETPTDTLQRIPRLLESIVREQPNARFERCHLKTLGDSALHFELSYFVQQPSQNPLLDLQQAVNFRIIDEFRRLGVEFDYPTQRVILARPRQRPSEQGAAEQRPPERQPAEQGLTEQQPAGQRPGADNP